MSTTSATRRLHRLVQHMQATIAAKGNSPGSIRLQAILQDIFNMPNAERRELFDAYNAVIRLCDRAVEEIAAGFPERDPKLNPELATALAPVVNLREAFLSVNIGTSVNPIANYKADLLDNAAAHVSGRLVGSDPTDDNLASAKEQLDAALETVLKSPGVSNELKEIIRAGIERIKRAIDQFRIFGPDAVLDELGDLYAHAAANEEARGESNEVIGKALRMAADATTTVVNAVSVFGWIWRIGHGGPGHIGGG